MRWALRRRRRKLLDFIALGLATAALLAPGAQALATSPTVQGEQVKSAVHNEQVVPESYRYSRGATFQAPSTTPSETSDSISWGAASVGAAAALGVALTFGVAASGLRQRGGLTARS